MIKEFNSYAWPEDSKATGFTFYIHDLTAEGVIILTETQQRSLEPP